MRVRAFSGVKCACYRARGVRPVAFVGTVTVEEAHAELGARVAAGAPIADLTSDPFGRLLSCGCRKQRQEEEKRDEETGHDPIV